jgi:hypothetical protein
MERGRPRYRRPKVENDVRDDITPCNRRPYPPKCCR